jgi:hypothetical protein
MLKWILKKWDLGHGLDLSGLKDGRVVGLCEHCIASSGAIKCGKCLDP